MKHYTTQEQGRHLEKIGIDRDTADMVYQFNFLTNENDEQPVLLHDYTMHDTCLENIPCWSTGALIELIPNRLEEMDSDETFVDLEIGRRSVRFVEKFNSDCAQTFNEDMPGFLGQNLCEAAYKAVVYLKEHKQI